MKILISGLIVFFMAASSPGQDWPSIKDAVSPIIEIPLEFDSLYRQPPSTTGWEDGLHISRDGLHLYCTYVPLDLLSFVLNGDLPNDFSSAYMRGAPTFGMDLISNPLGAEEWLHADILYTHRNTVNEAFSEWTLSDMARSFYSEGAPAPLFAKNDCSLEWMLFTSNDNPTNNTDIWMIEHSAENPSGTGRPLPPAINTVYNEDNPHLTRIDDQSLVLFFDSDNRPGGQGGHDIWFAESEDNGISWNTPAPVTTLNSAAKEHQAFLHRDAQTNRCFIYYSAIHTDAKLAIFRRPQINKNNWNSWGDAELVISAGNSAGIGEPTLTGRGDISFVVVYADPEKISKQNKFDSDPWFIRKRMP